MSGDHNMNQKITGTLFSVAQVDAIEREWADKLQTYINIHDAVVRDNDRLYELLRKEYERGYADAMNWKVQNHLEHLPPKENT